ncbi:hypothetical protein [Sphingomonas alpina]|uniref:Lipoprotein n=1 Tax=Sphingomonas alpina TaxID=653931 RepID=A0A7H0LLB4_9SPHN|nr:hypothetical protein [Sphingomonas alpina]QNQ10467.1 hypothetical protein H3Z74_04395 [Sphingomonas alpina]
MTRAGLAALLLCAAAPLTGCQSDIAVAVTSRQGLVEFSVPATRPPCIDRLTVYAVSDRKNPVWLIDSADRTTCVSHFQYARVPAGFTQRGSAAPLADGQLYLVAVGRPGATGISFFQPGTDGSITREAPEG